MNGKIIDIFITTVFNHFKRGETIYNLFQKVLKLYKSFQNRCNNMPKLKNQIPPNWKIISFAKAMRSKKATPQELEVKAILKTILKKKHIRVYNQFPIYDQESRKWYIVDFYIPRLCLVIEVDGWHHKELPSQVEYDKERTCCLHRLGLSVSRISNSAVKQGKAKKKLYDVIYKRIHRRK